MGLFTAVTSLFKRSFGTTEEYQDVAADVAASSTTTTTPVSTSSTSNAAEVSTTVSTPEPMVTARKIEDASTLPPLSSTKGNQPRLPGFEDDTITPPETKKKPSTNKSSAKLARKSTTKRKK